MKDHVGQQLIIGLKGTTLLPEEAKFIVTNNIGGVILFKRNVQSPEQIRELTNELQALRHRMPDRTPLFISIDMEGGRVARLGPPFTQWPPAAKIGAIDSTSVAFKFASFMGEELRSVGINLNFTPSVDVLTNPTNTAIGDRAFSSDPEIVAKLASAVVRGFIKAGVLPCAKHFPGHGNTIVDSHFELPVENKTLAQLEEVELHPFKKVFRARLDFLMTSHIKFPNIDPEYPVTLSKKFITDILRNQLRYRGLIISDDLGMKALASHWNSQTIATLALNAGVNILLYCNEPEVPPVALEAIHSALAANTLDKAVVSGNYKKIIELKKSKLTNPEPLALDEITKIVGHPDHLQLSKAIAEGNVPDDLVAT